MIKPDSPPHKKHTFEIMTAKDLLGLPITEVEQAVVQKVDYAAPRNTVEQELQAIWEGLLKVEKVGINDVFFKLGGNSLKAVSLMSKIHEKFSISLSLREIFDHPTIKHLSARLTHLKETVYSSLKPSEKKEYYLVSPAQRRLYILQQMELESISYNMPYVVTLNENIEREKLESTLKKLVSRHETLRTSFEIKGDSPVQRVHQEVDISIEYHNTSFTDLPPGVRDRKINGLIKNFIRHFDLSKAPLLRVGLITLDTGKHILLIDMHHIITDGTSQELLKKEFISVYSGDAPGPLSIQYKDFAEWQNSDEQRNLKKGQEEYWLRLFSGEIPVLNLPLDYKRPDMKSFYGAAMDFQFSQEETEDLKQLSIENGTTLFMTLLAIFNILIYKLSGQEDIVSGIPMAARKHSDLETVIGMFVNTLALRNYPGADKSFEQFLKEVKAVTLDAFENQDYQFEDLVERVSVRRDTGRNPIFDIMFNLLNPREYPENSSIVEKEFVYSYKNLTSKFDMTLTAQETHDGKLYFNLEYCTKLFHPGTIKRFITYFKMIARSVSRASDKKIVDIDILPMSEKIRLLFEFNNTEAVYSKDETVHELFQERQTTFPHNISVVFKDKQLTYKELNGRSNSLARVLKKRGVNKGDIVGLMVDHSLEMIIGIFGILKAGGAYLPLAPGYPLKRINYMLKDSSVKLVLTQKHFMLHFSDNCERLNLEDPECYRQDSKNLEKSSNSKDIIYVMYTSGTMGKPKGVMIEHRNVINLFQGLKNTVYNYKKTIRVSLVAPYVFDASVKQVFPSLLLGHALILVPEEVRFDGKKLVRFYKEKNIRISDGTPTHLGIIVNYKSELSKDFSLEKFVIGGEELEINHCKKLIKGISRDRFEIINVYGPTECCDVATSFPVTRDNLSVRYRIPIGKPLANVKIFIIGSSQKLQPIGVPGELSISGDGVSRGYLNHPENTSGKFISNPFVEGMRLYLTGDLARWRDDGNVEFLGRIDSQVKIRGYRIELNEIESALLENPGIKEAVVVPNEYPDSEKYLCAFLVTAGSQSMVESSLRDQLAHRLPFYMIPAHFVQLEKIPLTPNGKIDRKMLPTFNIDTSSGYEAPRDKVEERLAVIWGEVLGIKKSKISMNANFFQLGGHSLKAAILTSKIHKELKVKVPLAEIFKIQTIRGLAGYINKTNKIKYDAVETVEKKEYYELSPTQKRLYFLQQLDLYSTSYNMPLVLPIEKNIDKDRLESTLKRLIARHESLRTSFIKVNDVPYQRVRDEVEFNIEYYVNHKGTLNHKKTEAVNILNGVGAFIHPFDLARAPLVRVGVVSVESSDRFLLIDIHHIVTDGTSQSILRDEFLLLLNDTGLLPAQRLQYKDYSEWLSRPGQQKTARRQEAYWIRLFSDELPILTLPLDYPRPDLQSFEGGSIQFVFNRQETLQLKDIAKESGATLYMTLLSLFAILLSKLSGSEDIIIGTPIAARRHADLQKIVGMFVNTLAIRCYPSGYKTFMHFLSQVKEETLKNCENQEYPFEELVDKIVGQRDTSRNPIFDVMFNLLNQADYSVDIDFPGPDEKRKFEYKKQTSKFDLNLTSIDLGERLYFDLEYCSSLFKEKTVQRIIEYFKKITRTVLEDRYQELSAIGITTDEEKERLLFEFNDTKADFPGDKTIHQLFQEQVEKVPDKMALSFNNRHLTYRELNRRANQLAVNLREKGIGPDMIVGLMVERSLEIITGMLAILKAGGAYLPIDAEYPQARQTYMLKDSSVKLLLTNYDIEPQSKFKSIFRENKAEIVDLRDENLFQGNSANPEHINNASDLIYLIYTSGSTGRPKGVMLAHQNLVNLLIWGFRFTNLDFSSILQFATINFDASFHEIFSVLLSGGKLCLINKGIRTDIPKLLGLIERKQVKTVFFPMSLLKVIFSEKYYFEMFPVCVKHIQTAGEQVVVSNSFRDYLKEKGVYLHNHYGPSETHVVTTLTLEPKGEIPVLPSIGKPISNTVIYILDKYKNIQPMGVPGELYIGGIQVGRGYLNRQELTHDKFLEIEKGKKKRKGQRAKLYETGDLARWMPDGNIEFLGRRDNQVKIRGFRIECAEIESLLLNHDGVKEAVVLAMQNSQEEKYLSAYIVPNQKPVDHHHLREYLMGQLPHYMIPSYFMQIERIPLTPSGKVDRKALPVPGISVKKKDYTPPKNKIEKNLVHLWAEILNIDEDIIGIDSNFFQLGGHSLKATVLTSKIHKELKVRVPLAEIFKTQTIRKLAEYIGKANKIKYDGIEPVEKKEYHALSSAQKRLYFLQQLDLNSTSYNMPLVLPLGKNIKVHKLESAIKKLILRHESLRTFFEMVNGTPAQRIHDTGSIDISIDYFEANEAEAKKIVKNYIKPFDLGQAPLLRSGVINLPDTNYIWMVDLHHIISDGTSHTILTDDFLALYSEIELEPLRFHYKDFSQWQNYLLENGEIKSQEDYWLSLYGDAREIPRLNLPMDFKRPKVFTFAGDRYNFMLEREDAAQFKALGARQNATLFMNLYAVLDTLLYKYTGQTDIIIGSSIAGRPHADLQQIVGMFVNKLAMRNYPRGEKTYDSLLKEVVVHCVQAFDNQDVQFESLVDKLGIERDPSRNPLFDISIVVQNFRRAGDRGLARENTGQLGPANQLEQLFEPDENPRGIEYKNLTAKFDMAFLIYEQGENIRIVVEYYTGIFKQETIQRLASHFKNIVKAVVKKPLIRLKDIEIISGEEKQQVLYELNDTSSAYPRDKTLHELFAEQSEKTPDNIALVGIGPKEQDIESVCFSELNRRANQLAYYLYQEKHIRPDHRVGIIMHPTTTLVVAILGVLKAGGAFVPMAPDLPGERMKQIIKDARIEVVISQKACIRLLNRLQWECQSFHTFLCMDTNNIYLEDEEESEKNQLMNEELWEYVAMNATDDITGGGWLSSYTGEPLSREEMDEYGDNILVKLKPVLHKKMRVLEIGCASGITMYRIAPHVGFYYGTDLSKAIIEKNKERVKQEGHVNISLSSLAAHRIDELKEKNFDLIILNSVIQNFHGHNYLIQVLRKCVNLLGKKGIIFIGDIMDQELKEDLVRELQEFKESNRGKGYRTTTDYSGRLFISRGFWEDLRFEIPGIQGVISSGKIHTIENELTKFRYDTLITVEKNAASRPTIPDRNRNKYQDDLRKLEFVTSNPNRNPKIKAHHLAYVLYTSGTTGNPKGVLINHRNLINYTSWFIEFADITPQDHAILTTSFTFDAIYTQFFSSLLTGGELHVIARETYLLGHELLRYIREHWITYIKVTPSLFSIIVNSSIFSREMCRSLRFVMLGGEAIIVEDVQKARRVCPSLPFMNHYGPTETTIGSSALFIDFERFRDYKQKPTIGKPIYNTQAYILDNHLQLVPPGVPGELTIAGDGVGVGYLNRPELTAEKFCFLPPWPPPQKLLIKGTGKNDLQSCNHASMPSPHYPNTPLPQHPVYRTGDLARWLSDGNIELLGRIDQQIKIRGYRIELGEIESQLLKHDEVKEAVVIELDMESGDKSLCAYIIYDNEGSEELELVELKEYLSHSLPHYMIPSYFVSLEKIPLTIHGKLDRKRLPAPGVMVGDDYAAPVDEIEKQLVEIWSEVLGIGKEKLSIDANFFELGGHSLKATSLVSKIHKKLDVKFPLAEVFKLPVIREQAGYIRKTAKNKWALLQPVEKKEYYTLSSAQKRMYFLQQLDITSTSYNARQVLPLGKDIDITKLELTLKRLTARHESLRTSFVMVGGNPVQMIHNEMDFKISLWEVEKRESENGQNQEINHILESFIKPFDLSKVPLFRAALIKTHEGKLILVVDIHHILSDGISQEILRKELMALYSGEELPPINLQYKDYAEWQNSEGQRQIMAQQEKYWMDIFPAETPVLNLPMDYKRPEIQSLKGAEVGFVLREKETQKLNSLAKDNNATLYIVIISIFNVLLSKLSGQEDIVLGTFTSGRQHSDLDNVVGMFVNTVPLRNYPFGKKFFGTFLDEVKKNTLEAFENQEYQFEELVNNLFVKEKRETNRNPIFDVIVNMLNQREYNRDTLTINEKNLSQHKKKSSPAFDLVLTVIDLEEKVLFALDYSTKLFKPTTIDRFITYFRNILSSLAENPDQRLEEVEILSEKEKKEILRFSHTVSEQLPPAQIIHELFERKVHETPGRTALIKDGRFLTYNELNQRAIQMARLLRHKGVRANTIVGLLVERSFEMIVGILAIMKAGGAYLPIDPAYPINRILDMVNDSNPSILLTGSNILKNFSITELLGVQAIKVEPQRTRPRPPGDFDNFPKPNRSLIDYNRYRPYIGHAMVKHSIALQPTRGCPYHCAFCHRIWPKKHTFRSAENLLEEVRLYYNMGVRRFVIIDDVFNFNIKNSSRFFELIIKKGLKVQLFFPNGLRGDILSKDYIDLMVEAGTVNLDVALETASPRLQKLINKNLKLDKLKENLEYLCTRHPHVIIDMGMMIGFPTETEEEAMMTMEFLKSIHWVHFPYPFILKIHPRTDIGKLALENGISAKAISRSMNHSYHDVPETLPFSKGFAREFKAKFLSDYFFLKERLMHVLPYQLKVASENELVQKYNNYLPMKIEQFSDILRYANISPGDLGDVEFLPDDGLAVPDLNEQIKKHFPPGEKEKDALRVLLLDVSELFSAEEQDILQSEIPEPLGIMSLATYIENEFRHRVEAKIAKSKVDFDSYDELKMLIEEFAPGLIGIRTLSYYKDLFHRTVTYIRHWGIDVPIVAGGPYATMDYDILLQDPNVDLAVLGEGEITFAQLVGKMLENGKRFPEEKMLQDIPGIAYIREADKEKLKRLSREVVVIDKIKEQLTSQPLENLPITNKPTDLVYVIYTSGSTGKPKGIMLEHRNLANLMEFNSRFTNIDFSKVVQFHSISFDASFNEIFSVLVSGGELYLPDDETRSSIPALLRSVEENKIPTLFLPMSFLRIIFNEEDFVKMIPGCLRHIQTAGEQVVINNRFGEFLKKNKVYLHNHYGPSETHVVTALALAPGQDIPELPPIGSPLLNTSIYILDKANHLLPVGVPGELYAGGVQVGKGYLNNPEQTAEKFEEAVIRHSSLVIGSSKETNDQCPMTGDRLYKTGDLARWLPDGSIEFLGRMDNQVKIRGFRIEPGEIESQLSNYEDIQEAIVVANQDNNGNKFLAAYIVSGTHLETQQIREYLSDKLPDYMIPSYFMQLDKIPLSPSGKVDRKALPFPGITVSQEEYAAPGSEIEKKVLKIWADILNLDDAVIGIDANFFELGGHSLNAIAMASRIHKILNVKIPVIEIFRRAAVRELSEYIKESVGDRYISLEPVEKKDYYILSSAQKRLYILQQLDLESTVYNMPRLVSLEENVEIERLENAFKKLTARHESLRTFFEMVENEPIQRVHQSNDVKLKIEYRRLCARDTVKEEVEKIIKNFVQPFDLSKAPLLKIGLIRVDEPGYKHLLMLDMHHIITDGASQGILVREFQTLYDGKELLPLKLQYKDYSEWRNSRSQQQLIKQQEAYWLNVFSDELPVLNLPTDYPRPQMQSFAGGQIRFALAEKEKSKLEAMIQREGATLYMSILSIFCILLSKLSGQEGLIVGIPLVARNHADLENIVGMFVNTLAIRNFPSGEKRFVEFLNDVKEQTIRALENQDYPFEELVDNVMVRRDTSRNPLFDVIFNLLELSEYSATSPTGGEENGYGYSNITSKFDINLTAVNYGTKLLFSLEYCSRLFKKESIERFTRYFKKIVSSVNADPNIKISDIEIITEPEKKQILSEFNNTKKEYPKDKTIHRLFEREVEISPNRIAIVGTGLNSKLVRPGDQIHLTYHQLNKRANQTVLALTVKGIKPGAIVGIMGKPSTEMIIGILGILKAGGVYLPMDPEYPLERIMHILRDSNASILLTQKNLVNQYETDELRGKIIDLDICDNDSYGENSRMQKDSQLPGDLAYIIYTSGSTGIPKGVMAEHRNVVRLVKNTNYLDFREGERLLQTGALDFDASTFEIWGVLLNGLTLYLETKEEILVPENLKVIIKKNDITTMWMTAPLFNRMEDADIEIFSGLRHLLVGGDVLSPPHINRLIKKYPGLKVINGYGPTENVTFSTTFLIDKEYEENIPIGSPIANSTAYVVDRYFRLLPIGAAGELCVGGDGVARGCMNNVELTAEKFIADPFAVNGRWYRTGDNARWQPEGNIEFLGRIDSQVKIRGFRIELEGIENQLLKSDLLKDGVVIAREDAVGNKYLAAYVVSEGDFDPWELKDMLAKKLPEYMIPSFIVRLENLPLTPNGKVDRRALPEPEIKLGDRYTPPGDEIEKKLVEIWAEVLSPDTRHEAQLQESIGIHDNFFELGGHSLKATILTSKIHKELDVKVPLAEIFKSPTIRAISQYIKGRTKAGYVSITLAEVKEYYPLSSAQKRLYISQQMETGSTRYNMPRIMLLEGEIAKKKLEDAFKKLTRRHESLRTSFPIIGGEIVQRVRHYDKTAFEVDYYEADEDEAGKIIGEFRKAFDLVRAPLFRVGLVKMEGKRCILMFDMHHIITDGTSMDIFTGELLAVYTGKELPGVKLQYKDYSEWQNREKQKESRKQQEQYWLTLFAGFKGGIPVLDMPTDYPRPAVQRFEGSEIYFTIDREMTVRIRKLMSETDATLYMVLLAAYNILLLNYTGQQVILVGSPVSGRTHADLEQIIGLFANIVVMKNMPGQDKTFREFLEEVKENALEAFENQDYQFDELMEKLKIPRRQDRHPLIDTVFTLLNAPSQKPDKKERDEFNRLRPLPFQFGERTIQHELLLSAVEKLNIISMRLEYSTVLFKESSAQEMVNHYIEILEQITDDSRRPLKEIKISHDLVAISTAIQEEEGDFEF